jgi:phosphatidylserine/phosphatidylglycerophosphate/cardiolipin synthase-like enzyme
MRFYGLAKLIVFVVLAVGAVSVLRPHLSRNPIVRDLAPVARSSGTAGGGVIETHYSPEENLESIDVRSLRASRSSIEMFAYSLTDLVVIDALKYAAEHGAAESIYLDKEQTENELRRPALRAALLNLAATPNVTIRVKTSRILQHTKAYVIDRAVLREGSANFSPSALKQQDNDLFLTNETNAVQNFENAFQQAWNRRDNIELSTFAQNVN